MADKNDSQYSISIDNNAQHDLPEKFNDVGSLNEKLQLLEAENKSLSASLEFELDKSNEQKLTIANQEKDIEELTLENKRLEQNIISLEVLHNNLKDVVTSAELQKNELLAEVTRLANDDNTIRSQNESLHENIKRLELKIVSMKEQHTTLVEELEADKRQCEAKNKEEIRQLKQTIQSLQSQVDVLVESNNKLKKDFEIEKNRLLAQLKEITEEKMGLQQDKLKLQHQLSTQESQLKLITEEKDNIFSQLVLEKKNSSSLSLDLMTITEAKNNLISQLNEAQRNITKITEEKNTLTTALEVEKNNRKLQSDNDQAIITSHVKEIAKLKDDISHQNTLIAAMTEEKHALSQEILSEKNKVFSQMEEKEKLKATHSLDKTSLTEQINSLENDKRETTTKIHELILQQERLKYDIATQEREKEQLLTQIKGYEAMESKLNHNLSNVQIELGEEKYKVLTLQENEKRLIEEHRTEKETFLFKIAELERTDVLLHIDQQARRHKSADIQANVRILELTKMETTLRNYLTTKEVLCNELESANMKLAQTLIRTEDQLKDTAQKLAQNHSENNKLRHSLEYLHGNITKFESDWQHVFETHANKLRDIFHDKISGKIEQLLESSTERRNSQSSQLSLFLNDLLHELNQVTITKKAYPSISVFQAAMELENYNDTTGTYYPPSREIHIHAPPSYDITTLQSQTLFPTGTRLAYYSDNAHNTRPKSASANINSNHHSNQSEGVPGRSRHPSQRNNAPTNYLQPPLKNKVSPPPFSPANINRKVFPHSSS